MHQLLKDIKIPLSEIGTIKDYKANKIIFEEGSECNNIGLVLSGCIKIFTITFFEHEQVINYINKNEVFGDILLFANKPIYHGTGITTTDTIVLYISKEKLIDYLSSDKKLLVNYLNIICEKGFQIRQRNKLLVHKNIADRLLYYFIEQAKKNNSRIVYINNVTDLANLLSLPRPSVSRSLTSLATNGYIKRDGKKIYLENKAID